MILMYDFGYEQGAGRLPLIEFENAIVVHPGSKIRIRRRQGEDKEVLDLLELVG